MNKKINFLLQLYKANSILSRKLSSYVGFGEFMILYYLSEASDGKLRRIDLAELLGLTASGVTRMLIPMEKTGFVTRDVSDVDARARYAIITKDGKELLNNTVNIITEKLEDIIPGDKISKINDVTDFLSFIK